MPVAVGMSFSSSAAALLLFSFSITAANVEADSPVFLLLMLTPRDEDFDELGCSEGNLMLDIFQMKCALGL